MAGNKKEWSIAFAIGAKLQSSFGAAFKSAEKQIASLKKAASNAGAAWTDFAQKTGSLVKQMTLLSTAVVGGAFALGRTTATAADNIGILANKAGIGVEALQGYQYAATKSGMKVEEFNSALLKFRGVLAQGAKDAKSNPLQEFGLSAQKLQAMQPEKAMQRIADYMGKMKDPAEKARLAVKLFGEEGGPRMSALLAQGSEGLKQALAEFEKTGAGFTSEQVRQAGEYNAAWLEMGKSFESIRNKIGVKLIPVFTKLFEKVSVSVQNILPLVQEFADRMAAAIDANLPKLQEFAERMIAFGKEVVSAIVKVKDFVGGWGNVGKILIALRLLPVAISGVTFGIKAAIVAQKAFAVGFALLKGASLAALLPMLPIIAAIGLAAYVIYKNWDKVKEVFGKAFDKLKAAWDRVWPVLQADFYRIKEVLAKVMDAIGPIVQATFDHAVVVIENALNLIGPIFDVVINALMLFVDLFTGNWSKLGEDIAAVINSIQGLFSAVFDAVINIGKSFVSTLLTIFGPIADFLNGVGSKIGGIVDSAKGLGSKISGFFGGGDELPGHAAGGIFNKPHIARFAENAPRVPEAAIPVENTARSLALWNRVGDMAGFTGGGAQPIVAPVMGGGGGGTSISLSMPITISGNATPETVRSLEQSRDNIVEDVKRLVKEALADQASRQRRLSYAR